MSKNVLFLSQTEFNNSRMSQIIHTQWNPKLFTLFKSQSLSNSDPTIIFKSTTY